MVIAGERALTDDHQIGEMGAAGQFLDLVAGDHLEFIGKVAAREMVGDGLAQASARSWAIARASARKALEAARPAGRHGDRIDVNTTSK